MPSPESLIARIRGEYQEMPGLRLTFAQACRLWQVDPTTCETVLEILVKEGFLACTQAGAFVALPTAGKRLRTVKVAQRVLIEIEDECGGLPVSHLKRLAAVVSEQGRPAGMPTTICSARMSSGAADRTGLGLGLAFSRWGVEANGGRIYARTVPDKGCVFTVDLPRCVAPAVAV